MQKTWIQKTFGAVLLVMGTTAYALPPTNINTPGIIYEQREHTEKKPKENLPEVLFRIAECESHNRQFTDSGHLVRGYANPHDVGRFQISEDWNGEKAKELDYDIYTWQGNTDFALYLYKKNGTRDWNWSKSCWNKS